MGGWVGWVGEVRWVGGRVAGGRAAAQPFREIEKEKAGYHWKVKPELGFDAELGLLKEHKEQVGADERERESERGGGERERVNERGREKERQRQKVSG